MDDPRLLELAVGPACVLVHVLRLRDRFREPLGCASACLAPGAASVVPAVPLAWLLVPL